MNERDNADNDRFHVRPGAPKARPPRFIARVLKEVSKAGATAIHKRGGRPGTRIGRGHATARLKGRALHPNTRRVAIKTRLVNLRAAGARSTVTHLRYIERDGVGRDGKAGSAYGPVVDVADVSAFEEAGRGDRHQFRLIVAPEDAAEIQDLRCFTRRLMSQLETDLGTRLEWIAVDHWDTDNPHSHVALRGKDETGRDLVIAGEYIAHGMRQRASELATEWLGPRTELEIRQSLVREVDQERWTSLDRELQQLATGAIQLGSQNGDPGTDRRTLLLGRLQRLKSMGLAQESPVGQWTLRSDAENVLRAQVERADIVRTMQRAMRGTQRELVVSGPTADSLPIIGKVLAKGLADFHEGAYLVVDSIDGRAHYLRLHSEAQLEQFPAGGIVQASGVKDRNSDKTIAAVAVEGIYRTNTHLAMLRAGAPSGADPTDTIAIHVRRLEALRRAGVVERLGDGIWRVPADLPQRGRQYDAARTGSHEVVLQSHLPLERQVRAVGATWLDRQLVARRDDASAAGFGREVRGALQQRTAFLIDEGLADRRDGCLVLSRNLLATLRQRDVEVAAKALTAETGLLHHPLADGGRVTGVYRRNVMLASGRFAMLDDGMGFSLVPWKPVIEQRQGQTMTGTIRFGTVSWTFGKSRGPGLG